MMLRVLSGACLGVTPAPLTLLTPECLRIRVAYAGVNRADVLQRAGKYPPPPGASEILGLEVSGTVEEVGSGVTRFRCGDRIAALLSGGGYADRVLVEEELCFLVPKEMSLKEAGAIPENWVTAFQLTQLAAVQPTESVLIHAAASGVGSALLQLIKKKGCPNILAMCGSEAKSEFAKQLGATRTYLRHNMNQEDLAAQIKEDTNGRGVDVILDCVGASVCDLHLKIAAPDSRWVLYGSLGGVSVPSFSLARILGKRITLIGTTLRSRSLEYRRNLIEDFNNNVMPLLQTNEYKVQIDRILNWEKAEEALGFLETNSNCGKILLEVDSSIE